MKLCLGRLVACLALCALVSPLNASTPTVKGQCKQQFENLYKKDRVHKAFASTGSIVQFSTESGFACGGGFGFPTKELATKNAIGLCEKVKKKHHLGGKCNIVDVQ